MHRLVTQQLLMHLKLNFFLVSLLLTKLICKWKAKLDKTPICQYAYPIGYQITYSYMIQSKSD